MGVLGGDQQSGGSAKQQVEMGVGEVGRGGRRPRDDTDAGLFSRSENGISIGPQRGMVIRDWANRGVMRRVYRVDVELGGGGA